jgi:hypothetical protein
MMAEARTGRDLLLRRKWTLRAHGKQAVFVKRKNESAQHVIMKALLWALYLPQYPELRIETAIGDRFKPDLVQLAPDGMAEFWGEAGQVSVRKLNSLLRRFPTTHFALAKWTHNLAPHAEIVARAVAARSRQAPLELIAFPQDSVRVSCGKMAYWTSVLTTWSG